MTREAIPIHGSKFEARCIVDLNLSDTYRKDRKLILNEKGRVYSVKDKRTSRAWKLCGHSSRVLLANVSFKVSEVARLKVLESGQKSPHAFVDGFLLAHDLTDLQHRAILNNPRAVFISYNPYLVEKFVVCPSEHLAGDCSGLQRIDKAKQVYLYESGAIAIL